MSRAKRLTEATLTIRSDVAARKDSRNLLDGLLHPRGWTTCLNHNNPCISAGRQRSALYSPEFEHDACGVGFVAHLKGKLAAVRSSMTPTACCATWIIARLRLRRKHRRRQRHGVTGNSRSLSCAKVADRDLGVIDLPGAGPATPSATSSCRPTTNSREFCKEVVNEIIAKQGQKPGRAGGREVPTSADGRGHRSHGRAAAEPVVEQLYTSLPPRA